MSVYTKYKIRKKVRENTSVVSLILEPVEQVPLRKFKPGQHLLFKVKVPGDPVPILRHYSFSDEYNAKHYRISVKREAAAAPGVPGGKCSHFFCDELEEGAVLEAKGPIGDFTVDPQDQHPIVLIAGGIGITPLLSMLKSITRENPDRQVFFFYGVNSREEHTFREELQSQKEINKNLKVITFYATVREQDVPGRDYDHIGFLNVDTILETVGDMDASFYVCGPGPMLDYMLGELKSRGVAQSKLHHESFGGVPVAGTEPVEAAPPAQKVNRKKPGTLEIEFCRSGKRMAWNEAYGSILEFAEDHDVDIPSGCLFGDCGTCLTKVKSGSVRYNHPTLVVPGEDECLPCSSKPESDLILDV